MESGCRNGECTVRVFLCQEPFELDLSIRTCTFDNHCQQIFAAVRGYYSPVVNIIASFVPLFEVTLLAEFTGMRDGMRFRHLLEFYGR